MCPGPAGSGPAGTCHVLTCDSRRHGVQGARLESKRARIENESSRSKWRRPSAPPTPADSSGRAALPAPAETEPPKTALPRCTTAATRTGLRRTAPPPSTLTAAPSWRRSSTCGERRCGRASGAVRAGEPGGTSGQREWGNPAKQPARPAGTALRQGGACGRERRRAARPRRRGSVLTPAARTPRPKTARTGNAASSSGRPSYTARCRRNRWGRGAAGPGGAAAACWPWRGGECCEARRALTQSQTAAAAPRRHTSPPNRPPLQTRHPPRSAAPCSSSSSRRRCGRGGPLASWRTSTGAGGRGGGVRWGRCNVWRAFAPRALGPSFRASSLNRLHRLWHCDF